MLAEPGRAQRRQRGCTAVAGSGQGGQVDTERGREGVSRQGRAAGVEGRQRTPPDADNTAAAIAMNTTPIVMNEPITGAQKPSSTRKACVSIVQDQMAHTAPPTSPLEQLAQRRTRARVKGFPGRGPEAARGNQRAASGPGGLDARRRRASLTPFRRQNRLPCL